MIVKWAIIVATTAIQHSNTIRFILFEEKKKAYNYEKANGCGSKVAPQSFISERFLEHTATSETVYVLSKKHFLKIALFTHSFR